MVVFLILNFLYIFHDLEFHLDILNTVYICSSFSGATPVSNKYYSCSLQFHKWLNKRALYLNLCKHFMEKQAQIFFKVFFGPWSLSHSRTEESVDNKDYPVKKHWLTLYMRRSQPLFVTCKAFHKQNWALQIGPYFSLSCYTQAGPCFPTSTPPSFLPLWLCWCCSLPKNALPFSLYSSKLFPVSKAYLLPKGSLLIQKHLTLTQFNTYRYTVHINQC